MSERFAFITACLNRTDRISEICDRFGISEKTGYKWLHRFKTEGLDGLANRSHAPRRQAHQMSAEIAEQLVALRRKHPLYGPQKLRDWLTQHHPAERWPAASSIGALLKREHLIRAKRRRHRAAERAALDGVRTPAREPNMVWTADFKGEFRLATGRYCYPLTVLDLFSHYSLGCSALTSTAVVTARAVFVRLFREYGLPVVMRTDNGIPFAHPNALGRLGALAFWWVRLGIRPEHITPARPAENGAHERFHRTLAAATTRPAAPSFPAQQRRFDRFRAEYNTDRPHASLPAHRPPGSCYTPATRPYPTRLPTLCYPSATDVRRVDAHGYIHWQTHALFLSSALAGQYVGLTRMETELVTIAYASLALGDFDEHTNRFTPRVRWTD
jgi:transposase InsO family protein